MKVKKRIFMITPLKLLLVVGTHWQVEVCLSGPEIAQYFSEFCPAALVAIQKFLEMRYCLESVLKRISSYFGHAPSLATVSTQMLLAPTKEFLELASELT